MKITFKKNYKNQAFFISPKSNFSDICFVVAQNLLLLSRFEFEFYTFEFIFPIDLFKIKS